MSNNPNETPKNTGTNPGECQFSIQYYARKPPYDHGTCPSHVIRVRSCPRSSLTSFFPLVDSARVPRVPPIQQAIGSLWLCQQFAIENGHRNIVDFPMKHCDFLMVMLVYQREIYQS